MAEPQPLPLPAKTSARDQLLAARRRRPLTEVAEAAARIARHVLAAPEVGRAATVAAYVSIGGEPGTSFLLDALAATGRRVLLPRLLPDGDLDWGTWRGDGS
ncbi:MAG TPA: 5-formyltetrahydrofolate cyclo-ligase, partial [Nocardioides sp.]|uniref:5-formyltetrahydrofolate cyclo-ligase n=1 Tax=Nocardioides sp. TaxID=35761 RepID=UPI002ED8E250